MATRAPFVSLFSGVSIGGNGRGSKGFLDVKLPEKQKDSQTGGNTSCLTELTS